MSIKTALVVGFGSIGERHAYILQELGFRVLIVSNRKDVEYECFSTVYAAFQCYSPDYVVISNQTALHLDAVNSLADVGYRSKLLVEKPLFHRPIKHDLLASVDCRVAYQLRFLPVIRKLRETLRGEEVLMVSVRVGQHLSTWRKGRDVKDTYSASHELGGGVLRDLSHELDYCVWLFGDLSQVKAFGGNKGALGVNSDELWTINAISKNKAICNIQLSYLDVPARRNLVINTRSSTFDVDLMAGSIVENGQKIYSEKCDRNFPYRELHKSVLEGHGDACTYHEAFRIIEIIDEIEREADGGEVVV